MLETRAAYERAGIAPAPHFVAVTSAGSRLDQTAESEGWLGRFPMFDWVGGRTSELSAVGLLPAALQGLDIDGMLAGAAECDRATRTRDTRKNPSAMLALMWHNATGGKGHKDMVIGLSQFRDHRRLTLPWLLILPFIGDLGKQPINR